MKILIMSNTYFPIVGGLEESISTFANQFRMRGHQVKIVTPEHKDAKPEEDVIRLPALQNYNNTDFSINLPIPGILTGLMNEFKPDIMHSQHPFLLGDMALRISAQFQVPLVFTYHTMYEQYVHYLPVRNDLVRKFVEELSAGYANLVDSVIAPSKSICDILLERHVETPISVIPTGIDLKKMANGDGQRGREKFNIPKDAFVIGTVGRLAIEKNLEFLTKAVGQFIKDHKGKAYFLVIGDGDYKAEISRLFGEMNLSERLILAGVRKGQELVDGYHAMDLFAFASKTETQGLVVIEALASGGVPVVALDATGVREVVQDKKNGRLLPAQEEQTFVAALQECAQLPAEEFKKLKAGALASVEIYSQDICAEKMLNIYRELKHVKLADDAPKRTVWSGAMERVKTEWDMLKNVVEAGGRAITGQYIEDKFAPKWGRQPFMVRLRRWINRSEWTARLLGLSKITDEIPGPGLVLIQIDGFSRLQLEQALKNNRMPFCKQLLKKEGYRLYPMYTGLPSSTPAVQGELFYGVKQAVPAFSYFDSKVGRVMTMYDGPSAVEIEQRLAYKHEGLLKGGSSYSNVYTGGAAESHFCAVTLGINKIWKDINPLKMLALLLTHFFTCVRIAALLVLELLVSFVDFFVGVFRGEKLSKELEFVPLRALICILLRELLTLGGRIDIIRGLPIIHMNYLGYDEQSHRRGPSSHFAHWALSGIDASIARLYREALYATSRNYDVWIYSDHGHEDNASYKTKYGIGVDEAIAKVFEGLGFSPGAWKMQAHGVQYQRARYLAGDRIRKPVVLSPEQEKEEAKHVIVTAIGPTGNIYLPRPLEAFEREVYAQRLVEEAKIPLVLAPEPEGKARAWTAQGVFNLPEDAAVILGERHPYLEELTRDLQALVHHEHAGAFTFSGWRPGEKPMTFPVECGAHAGPGTEETNAFALLPSDIKALPEGREYLKTADLRECALRFLKRKGAGPFLSVRPVSAQTTVPALPVPLRVMTYNVRSCIGMDGRASPERIARVIGRHEPDIVAIQELDCGRIRTASVDQPQLIAKALEMMYHFHPVIHLEEERYGTAILTRFPLRFIQAKALPTLKSPSRLEARGAIWTEINVNGTLLQFISTHLGLNPKERMLQIQALIGPDWLGNPACQGPVILAGDFNALPGSAVYRLIQSKLRDAQTVLKTQAPKATWLSHYPVGRIDHIFLGPQFDVIKVMVPRTQLDQIASDHLPLIIDLNFKKEA